MIHTHSLLSLQNISDHVLNKISLNIFDVYLHAIHGSTEKYSSDPITMASVLPPDVPPDLIDFCNYGELPTYLKYF